MPPITKENETRGVPPESAARTASNAALPNDAGVKAQPVALEISVTVNGARAVEGSDKREPFSERTKTVLVFGTGAVIRLSSSVAPGQLLFLTNEKTKKEVVCQVVKSKNYRNVSGYVELEFTEQVAGFWGMRFPGDHLAPVPQPAANVTRQINESKPSSPAPVALVTPASLMPDLSANSAPVLLNPPISSPFDSPRAPESKASIFAPSPETPAAPPTVNVTSLSPDADLKNPNSPAFAAVNLPPIT